MSQKSHYLKTTSFSKVQGVIDTEGGTAKGQNSDQKQLVCLCVHAHIHKAAHAHVCICLCIYIFLSSGYFFFFSFVFLFPQFAIHLISNPFLIFVLLFCPFFLSLSVFLSQSPSPPVPSLLLFLPVFSYVPQYLFSVVTVHLPPSPSPPPPHSLPSVSLVGSGSDLSL